MANENSVFSKFSILRDDPLYKQGATPGSNFDAFDHSAYASALYQLLTDNGPPLVIGLFGPWGIGKSTVLNMLFSKIRAAKEQKLRPIYFNAWKYSGDSFRRQFLIEVGRQVYEGKADKEKQLRRLELLNYTDVLREESGRTLFETIKTVFAAKVRFRESGVARLMLASVVLLFAAAYIIFPAERTPFVYSFLIILLTFFSTLKFEDLVVIQETPLYDPKLIFPEQFEAEFRDLVKANGPLGKSTAIIAIDDIDRCESSTVRDILTSIKTFVGEHNCFFLVPCDDKTIVEVFAEPSQKSGYKDEMLRKYFNVGLRMAPLMDTDLADLANAVSRETKIPQAVVQMAILANCRDARKLKHFLNTFAVKYAVAKAREQAGLLPGDIDKNLAGFAKAVLIEDLYPGLFAEMVRNPRVYESIEKSALHEDPNTKFDFGQFNAQEDDIRELMEILRKTRDTKIENLESLLALKTSNVESRIPRGGALKNAIISGDDATARDIIATLTTETHKNDLANLLIGMLESQTETFLKNSIAISLGAWSQSGLFEPADAERLAARICYCLLRTPEQKVLQQRPEQAWRCAIQTGAPYPNLLAQQTTTEVGALNDVSDGLLDIINTAYRYAEDRVPLANELNRKFESWSNTARGLSMLLALDLSPGLNDPSPAPSRNLLKNILKALNTNDETGEFNLNSTRRDVLFKYWNNTLAEPLAQKLVEIMELVEADSNYSPPIAFVVESILTNSLCIESETGAELLAPLNLAYARITNADAKFKIHKCVLLIAIVGPETALRSTAEPSALQHWRNFSDARLREVLSFLSVDDEVRRRHLRKQLIEQELSIATSEIPDFTDRTLERLALCFENRALLDERALEDFFLQSFETFDDAPNTWWPIITEYAAKLGASFALQVADKSLADAGEASTFAEGKEMLGLFGSMLGLVNPVERPPLLQKYFALCRSSDESTRDSAVTVLEAVKSGVESQDFRLSLNASMRDLCDIQPHEILSHRKSLDGVLKYEQLIEGPAWRDLVALVKRLLQEADATLKAYGIALVSRIRDVSPADAGDLVRLLIIVAQSESDPAQEDSKKALKRFSPSDLDESAGKMLDEFRKTLE